MTSSKFKIDPRTPEDIKAQIKELAASYTPEWVFDPDDPDIGSVIGLIFGEQLSDNIDRLNHLPEKYRTEFVNMLNIGLQPAHPARGVVVMELIHDTVSGANVPAGTKLLGDSEDGSVTVFETLSDLYVTNSRLSSVLTVSPEFGRIIPILGDMKKAPLISGASHSDDEAEQSGLPVFSLFDFNHEGIQQNALLLYHRRIFDTQEDIAVAVRIISADENDISNLYADTSRYRWSYYDGKNLVPFEDVSAAGGTLLLRRNGELGKMRLGGENADDLAAGELSLICLEALGKISESMDFKSIQISSSCAHVTPSFISHNENEMEAVKFMPFGEQASIFDECYIGHDKIFNQQGAFITLSFELSHSEKLITFTPEQEEEQLKIIKRKPRQVVYDTARTCVQRVSYEYFNGTGWKRLIFAEDWTTLFDGHVQGKVDMLFVCPDDWQPITIGANTERVIRVRVSQADNCYLQPCIHNMPVVRNFSASYSYMGDWKLPHRLRKVHGTEVCDLTPKLLSGEVFTAFEPLRYSNNALFLGFNRKMEGAPVSLFFEVDESVHFSGCALKFEYSTIKGFSELRVRDNTRGLSGSGTVMFVPGGDFAPAVVEGEERYWLRITDEENAFNDAGRYRPVIRRILPNAAAVHNVRTMEEEAFYIEAATANMSFPLAASNILFAEVFVNERGLSHVVMQELLQTKPGDVRAGYDSFGRITDFFVRWSEVENFDSSKADDRHYALDRMNNRILFGDGINVKIPAAGDSAAFTATVRCCNGAAGNLPENAINSVMGNVLYVDKIYNPVPAYGGSNIESVSQAIERGANIINSKNRLVSELDFVREVCAASDMITQAKCIIGQNAEGKKKSGIVSLVVLMRDYSDGAYSFDGIKDDLRRRLLEKSEATLTDADLYISEPVFVTLTADIWVSSGADIISTVNFEAQSMIIESVKSFIESNAKIGELPAVGQLKVMLNTIRSNAVIRHFTITASYTDANGTRERELSALDVTPFMLGVSGAHKIHIL
jgi:hypothetical protein